MAKATPSPPLPDLVYRVGVTGHRTLPAGVRGELRDGIATLLAHVRSTVVEIGKRHADVYAHGGKATLVAVSPMARGADRLVARAAAALHFELDAPTPYDLTRTDSAIADPSPRPGDLYEKARAHFILDGIRGDVQSYVEVGRRVVWNSDLLIAVWDGRPPAGPGGTAEIVRLAREHEIPVVHFHTERAGAVTLYAGPDPVEAPTIEELLSTITRVLELALAPPSGDDTAGGHKAANLLGTYFKEKTPGPLRRLVLGKAYGIVTGLVALPSKIAFPSLSRDCVAATRAAWRENWKNANLPRDLTDQVEERLLTHFAWANHLSILYAIRYRSAFFWIYLLAVLAVAAAVTSHLQEVDALELRAGQLAADCARTGTSSAVDCRALGREMQEEQQAARGWTGVELGILLVILYLFFWGKGRKFHEKWVDYRSLAERIRHLIFLMPLGSTSPAIRVPVPAQHADPSATWLNWLFRAVVRQAGMFDARVNQQYLVHCRLLLGEDILRGQASYHDRVSRRLGALHHRLDFLTLLLFGAAILVSALHYCHITWTSREQAPFVLAVLLPAIGAAVHGFLSQGDFENVALRAESAHRQLTRLCDDVAALHLATPAQRQEVARASRGEQLAVLSGESLRELAEHSICDRLDSKAEPALEIAVPDLAERRREWRATVARLSEDELRELLEQRPLREFPPAASAELVRYARHAADIMGDELIGWRADSQVRPLVLA